MVIICVTLVGPLVSQHRLTGAVYRDFIQLLEAVPLQRRASCVSYTVVLHLILASLFEHLQMTVVWNSIRSRQTIYMAHKIT